MAERPIKYPIGIQNFEKLREEDYLYIDKTRLVYQLAQQGSYYFLSRPRRFGKSLLLSTMEAYFEGKRELFRGLAIDGLETQWVSHPVLHLDLNASQYTKTDDLLTMLNVALTEWEKKYGSESQETTPSTRFAGIIRRAYEQTGQKVVVLIDEYDKPMAINLENEPLQDEFRNILKAFYGVMKSTDRYIRMGFLTGVTKFSKISVFSDLNNIEDISMDKRFATICGMTEQEIRHSLDGEVGLLARANEMDKAQCYDELRSRYDGYHFHPGSDGVYNPFSLLITLSKQEFGNYWFETGTPTHLVSMLKRNHYNLNNIENAELTAQQLWQVDSVEVSLLPILYQSGYLTIKSYDKRFKVFRLGYPNAEVSDGFTECLVPLYTNIDSEETPFNIVAFVKEIEGGKPREFMTRLAAMLADTDYRVIGDAELYFQNFLYVFFRLLGIYVEVERPTSDGRMDMVIKTKSYIYIIEFKMNQTADAALRQIEDKNYAAPFASDMRTIYKIGVNFNLSTRCVDDWEVV